MPSPETHGGPAPTGHGRRWRFAAAVLDPDAHELVVEGEPVDLEPRAFEVLQYLVEHRSRAVPKEELLDAIWGDRFVGESALTSQIKHVRSAIGDDGKAQSMIRTVHRVGYRFVAPVEEDRPDDHADDREPPATRPEPSPAWSVAPRPSVFGRDRDLGIVRERLAGHRLVTLTGPAGIGKTSLARSLAAEGTGDAPWWFCELGDTRDPDAVPNVVLSALGESQQADAGPTESVMRVLELRSDVVVLDNCEHLLDAARRLTAQLLERCPSVRVLATSREPLAVGDESVHPLDPLDLDDAVACFVARARDAGGSVDPADPALRELCARLDGVPLALELAAARARLLQPAEMLGLLRDRFRLLRGPAGRDGPETSLHAAIASSWEALEPDEQSLLARLSVFVGSFTIDDARTVAMAGADPLDAVDELEKLVRRSLVVVGPGGGARTGFRLLESVRDFAAARLADPAAARRAHVDRFTERAEQLDADGQTERIDTAIAEMRATWVNLRAAVGYASEAGDTTSIRRIVRAVAEYADVFAVYELGDWCERADLDGDLTGADDVPLAAEALAVQARTLAHRGRQERARELAERALALHESHATLLTLAWCAYYTGQLDLVVDLAPRMVELSRSPRGFDRGYADGFAALVLAVRQEGDVTTTTMSPAHAEQGVLGALDALTEGLRLCTADPATAAGLLEAVVEASLRHDYRLLLGAAASTLNQITLPARPPDEAMRILKRTLTRYRERSMWTLISADIVMAARLLADAGQPDTAARLLGARLASGYASGLSEVLSLLLQDELASALGDRYESLVEQGRAWRPHEAAAVAIDAMGTVLDGTPG
jgi:predicted ATPase/DNA-binding winged helix-turn-helix (wHTH) protein